MRGRAPPRSLRDHEAGTRSRRLSARPLAGRHVALLFGQSLRTRCTFTVPCGLGRRGRAAGVSAHSADARRRGRRAQLERWVVACVVRTFGQEGLQRFAGAANRMHVINALTDEEHPCQVLADMLTMRERFGELKGRTLAFIGDGNNVATSLAHAGAMLGMHIHVASPKGYELPQSVARTFERIARDGATLSLITDPLEPARAADALYTDHWTSWDRKKNPRGTAPSALPGQCR